jgi:hypothetical protein
MSHPLIRDRRMLFLVIPLMAGLLIAGVTYFGNRYFWGGIQERIRLAQDTTSFAQAPRYIGKVPMFDGERPLQPYAIALSGDSLFVTSLGSNWVDIYDAGFAHIGRIVLEGSSMLLSSVMVSGDRILIADRQQQSLRTYTRSGKLVERYEWLPGGTERLGAYGLAMQGSVIYVTDVLHRQIHAISSGSVPGLVDSGELLFSAPLHRDSTVRFEYPVAAAVTADGRLLVSDISEGIVQVFACDGRYAYSIPETRQAFLAAPHSIAFDNLPNPELLARRTQEFDPSGLQLQGRIHVVDRDGHRVCVFDPTGQYVLNYGSSELTLPNGIVIDQQRRLIVLSDTRACALSIFHY